MMHRLDEFRIRQLGRGFVDPACVPQRDFGCLDFREYGGRTGFLFERAVSQTERGVLGKDADDRVPAQQPELEVGVARKKWTSKMQSR